MLECSGNYENILLRVEQYRDMPNWVFSNDTHDTNCCFVIVKISHRIFLQLKKLKNIGVQHTQEIKQPHLK